MVGNYPVVTLCGSTRFKDEFMEAQKRLTLDGNIVISVGLFGHSGDREASGIATSPKIAMQFIYVVSLFLLCFSALADVYLLVIKYY